MEALLKGITDMFSKGGAMSGIMDMMGGEGFANLIKGGSALYGGMQAGDMMDFSQSMANKADSRQDVLMGNLAEDRQRDKDLNFDFNYTS